MKLIRITTVPISLKLLLTGQLAFMKKAGFDVVAVSSNGDAVEDVLAGEDVKHVVIPYTRTISPFRDLYCLLQTIKLFKKIRPDIVHTHTPKAGLIGMLAARITKVPVRIHTVAGLPLMTASGLRKLILKLTECLTYWGAQYVLPNSKSISKYMVGIRIVDESKMHVIGYGSSNGIDLNRYSKTSLNKSELNAIKESIDYNSSTTYLIAIGRIVNDKGIVELVHAFRIYSESHSEHNIKLILLGPIEKIRSEELLSSSVLEEIQNNNSILHVAWTDKVEYYLELADVLIHASHREGFPNVVLQAGAMCCPIICSNVPGNIDIVEHKKYGLLFEKENVNDLLNSIIYALDHKEEMKKCSINLRNRIEKFFSRDFVHQELLNFYKSKINSN